MNPGCLLCGCCRQIQGESKNTAFLCEYCLDALSFRGSSCKLCGVPLYGADLVCPDCLDVAPFFDQVVFAVLYEHVAQKMIHRIKRFHDLSCLSVFADLLGTTIEALPKKPDLLAAVPVYWKKNLNQGNNVGFLLGSLLGKVADIPFEPLLFSQVLDKPEQKKLSASKRKAHLVGYFSVNRRVRGLSVGIVDDVMTTGATMNELSRLLKLHGACEVYPLVCCRTPKK